MNILGINSNNKVQPLDLLKDVYFITMSITRVPIFHTELGQFRQMLQLKSFEQLLEPYGYKRLHPSNFVNVNKIEQVVESKSLHPEGRKRPIGYALFQDSKEIALISENYLKVIDSFRAQALGCRVMDKHLVTTVIDPTGKKKPREIDLVEDVYNIRIEKRVPVFYTKYGTYYQSNSLATFDYLTYFGYQLTDTVNLVNCSLVQRVKETAWYCRAYFNDNIEIFASISRPNSKDFDAYKKD